MIRFVLAQAIILSLLSSSLSCSKGSRSEGKSENISSAETERAAEILGLIPARDGSTTGGCTNCHGSLKHRDEFKLFADRSNIVAKCLESLDSDEQKFKAVQCLAGLPVALPEDLRKGIESGKIEAIQEGIRALKPHDLAFFTAALTTEAFRKAFTGNGDVFLALLDEDWLRKAAMPKNREALSEADFNTVKTWLGKNYEGYEKFTGLKGSDACSSSSDSSIGEKFKDHVRAMSEGRMGWKAKNEDRGVPMFACGSEGCFQQKIGEKELFPVAKEIPMKFGETRLLSPMMDNAQFWLRSSADGKYIGFGGEPSSSIYDLTPRLAGKKPRRLDVRADYDPAFTPDNQNFMFQGGVKGSVLCHQSLIEDTKEERINLDDKRCSGTDLEVGLYQSIGTSLDDDEIVMIDGSFAMEAESWNRPPTFNENASLTIHRIQPSDSEAFAKVGSRKIATPFIGNWVLSPSQRMFLGTAMSVKDGKMSHGGFRLAVIDPFISHWPSSFTEANTAQLCIEAAEKPQISFDERFLVFSAASTFQMNPKMEESSSDLFAIDLLGDGQAIQLTNMPKGYYVSSPHFRSDGWIYFKFFNALTRTTSLMATDAVVQMGK